MFDPVPTTLNLPELERQRLSWWREHHVLNDYLKRNSQSPKRFSFIDGPITANNPMGIHHAWGRTYKDLFQRFRTMQGYRQRYQNGFDCQGLWVEVEVEKDLGFNSKRDIEDFGIGRFVELCKERVLRFSKRQTEQSIRLGYFMDWEHSYYTMSDENNYMIWSFLKRCHDHGWIYRGHDVMPWCIRCGTALSEHEIATEGYREIEHQSVYVRLPLLSRPNEYLLVWTTTPWTLLANVATAVNPELTYVAVEQEGAIYYLSKRTVSTALHGTFKIVAEIKGSQLVGWRYRGPFDDLPVASREEHEVLPWADVGEEEGTGIVHIAPSCGREDLHLWQSLKANRNPEKQAPIPSPIDELGVYVAGFGNFTGHDVATVTPLVFESLASQGLLYHVQPYRHRYPVCWRCGSELVFRLVDEWFIALNEVRPRIMRVAEQIRWIPSFGLERELDWLRNMDDWMISKKRYWGLALPFFPCTNCGHLEVIGSYEELAEKSIGPLPEMPSPHRPWIDAVRIRCPQCGQPVARISDVGNPWLDAGIVAFSTLSYRTDHAYWAEWFPADFITESFPGQYRNWFYSLLTMATVLEDRPPCLTILGHGQVRDEQGREMHKSWGNSIDFDQAAERVGADTIRWLYTGANPANNVNIGWTIFEEVTRRLLTLWNSYSFFVTYANLDGFDPSSPPIPISERSSLDRWLLARLQEVISICTERLTDYDTPTAHRELERFIEDLSTWYIRRGRRRYWKSTADSDKAAAYTTLYEALVTLSKLLAPFMPFIADEIYTNLAGRRLTQVPLSVHLTDWPTADEYLLDHDILQQMSIVREIVEIGRAARSKAGLKVRQSLPRVLIALPSDSSLLPDHLLTHIREELNVKEVQILSEAGAIHDIVVQPNLRVIGPKYGPRVREITTLLRNGNYTVNPDGTVDTGKYHLTSEEVNLLARPRAGLAVAENAGIVVALDTTITPDLQLEGQARDVVRHIQVLRKDAGLQLQDRILIGWRGSDAFADLLDEWGEYIRAETLANAIIQDALGAEAVWQGTIGSSEVELSIQRVVNSTSDAPNATDGVTAT